MPLRSYTDAGSAWATASAQPRGPNILLFLPDQETKRVRRSPLKFPNRERLERRRTRFERNRRATPQCPPARSTLLSGRYAHLTGILGNIGASVGTPLRTVDASLGNAFQKIGYFGKRHLSRGSRTGWEDHGVESAKPADGGGAAVAESAVRWIARTAGQPWLRVVSLLQPDDIYEYPCRTALAALKGRRMPIGDGIPASPDFNGRSLRPPLEQTGSVRRGAVFAEYYCKQRWVNPARAVRTERWKLVEYVCGGREIYDFDRDSAEAENLAGNLDHRQIERKLLVRINEWAGRTRGTLRLQYRPLEPR